MEQSGEEGDMYAIIAYIKSEDKKAKGKEEEKGEEKFDFREDLLFPASYI